MSITSSVKLKAGQNDTPKSRQIGQNNIYQCHFARRSGKMTHICHFALLVCHFPPKNRVILPDLWVDYFGDGTYRYGTPFILE
jgi:hypothetical protein